MFMSMLTEELLERLRNARRVVVFTGAGVSQESGIPTFRDALTGLWENYDASSLATPEAFVQNPDLVWGWYEWRRAKVLACQPNAAHRAIAKLATKVANCDVITQNVDDLHERAGSTDVVHLHGSLHAARCNACGLSFDFPPGISDEPEGGRHLSPPVCVACAAQVRPGVVWFGEPLPQENWIYAESVAKSCDVFFSIGTSSMVYPAAQLPMLAASAGAYVVQLNPQATDLDQLADCNLRGKAGVILPTLIQAVWP